MKNKDADSKADEHESVCHVCGGTLNGMGECTTCGRKIDGSEVDKASVIKQFSDLSGVGEAKAELLFARGYRSLDDLQGASLEDLTAIDGIGDKLAKNIKLELRKHSKKKGRPEDKDALSQWLKGSDDSLAVWLGGEGKGKAPDQPQKAAPQKKGGKDDSYTTALRRWLTGEEDTLKLWLTEVGE